MESLSGSGEESHTGNRLMLCASEGSEFLLSNKRWTLTPSEGFQKDGEVNMNIFKNERFLQGELRVPWGLYKEAVFSKSFLSS